MGSGGIARLLSVGDAPRRGSVSSVPDSLMVMSSDMPRGASGGGAGPLGGGGSGARVYDDIAGLGGGLD